MEIAVNGASNFRDLAWPFGAPGHAGAGRIFRSAHLDRLSAAGLRTVAGLGIGLVIDLRGASEAAAAPSLEGVARVHLPIEPTVAGELMRRHAAGSLTAAVAAGIMEDAYRRFVTEHAAVFARMLEIIAEPPWRPVVFHCAAGKDRTGVAAALILTALGADPAAIMEDYLLSNRFYRAPVSSLGLQGDVREAIMGVRPSYLEAAFAAIREGWGGADQYLERALGVGPRQREALREALLAPRLPA